jgi:N-acetylglucosaminyldiphosphoundecaprenol N-acetyl-beta-D-mannosaminyltransferase
MTAAWPRAELAGQELSLVTLDTVVDWLTAMWRPQAFSYVVTANLAHLDVLAHDEGFREAYRQADVRVIDGAPIIWLLRRWHYTVPERVAGADLVAPVLEQLARRAGSVAIIGGRPGTEHRIESAILARYPGLGGCRVIAPPMGFDPASSVAQDYALQLATECADDDVLFLCLGAPKQEMFACRWAAQLPAVRALCCGAAIDMLIGDIARAPVLLQRTGLEWLYRLLQDPRRLYLRYFRSAVVFFRLVLAGPTGASRLWTSPTRAGLSARRR